MIKLFIENKGLKSESFEVLGRAMKRRLTERGLALADGASGADYTLTVKIDGKLSEGCYVIDAAAGKTVITAADDCAAHAGVGRFLLESSFAGVGRFLLESSFDGKGGFKAYEGKLDFKPRCPLRGMYFATHFYNYYHIKPIEEVYDVIEDLAMRGCNSLLVWFDMHHFNSVNDPEAQELIERLRAMIKYANKIGIAGSLTMLGNEGFASSPVELRAEWEVQGKYFAQPEGHYHVEICPNKEGGIEEILRERRSVLECFKDLDIAYISYWPYDQGGCTCEKCQPWGSNGFIKLFPHFRALVKEVMPKTKLIFSTWYFDKFVPGEWDAFYPMLTDGTLEGVDYIMSFFFHGKLPECIEKNGIPEGVKFIDFPEISMYSCMPWGGFGASILANFINSTNAGSGALYSGGFPYSEGVFEDCNKFIELMWYSGVYTDARDAVRAYAKFEFCLDGEELDRMTDAILATETGLRRSRIKSEISGDESDRFEIQNPADVEKVYRVMTKFNETLPEAIRKSYRFRLFYLRALIDRELVSCEGYPLRSEVCQRAMTEVNEIYGAVEETMRWVKAPVGK